MKENETGDPVVARFLLLRNCYPLPKREGSIMARSCLREGISFNEIVLYKLSGSQLANG
jgi:hypothetical protein